MSQLADIKLAQDTLEESFSRRMAELESQLSSSGPAKETVARVAEEFRAFRELMCTMLSLLRNQINQCTALIDDMETRHRRKALVFLGVAEEEKEDCAALILKAVNKMEVRNITAADITSCHRIGAPTNGHPRPILIKFARLDVRSAVWRGKTRLRGSNVTVKEFLTRMRQTLFVKARQHFGMRSCWTQDGTIIVKAADGSRHKITTAHQLSSLQQRYRKTSDISSSGTASGSSTESITATGASAVIKSRK